MRTDTYPCIYLCTWVKTWVNIQQIAMTGLLHMFVKLMYLDCLQPNCTLYVFDVQATVEREGVQQLQCFRQLPYQLSEASEAVQQLMAADLLTLLCFHALPHLKDHLVAAIMQQQEYLASG